MDTLIIIGFALYFVSICAFFFLGLAIMRTQKNRELVDCRKRVKESEEERRILADTVRRISQEYVSLKHSIRRVIKRYTQMSKSPFGKALKGVIDGK